MADTNIVFRCPNAKLNIGGQDNYENILFQTDTYSHEKNYTIPIRSINGKTLTVSHDPVPNGSVRYAFHMKLKWDD